MIDIDEYIEMWDDNLLGSEGVNDLMNALIAEVKRLRDHIRRMRHWAEPKMHEVHHDAWRKLHEEIYEGDD